MAIPAALVTVRLNSLQGITGAFLAGTKRVYATTKIGARPLGRTAAIAAVNPTFALNRELEVAVSAGQNIDLEVDIWDDREDLAPNRLAHITATIAPPWKVKNYTAGGGPTLDYEVKIRRRVPTGAPPPVAAPRVGSSAPPAKAAIRLAPVYCVEITEILGLYDPGFAGPHRANYHAGYISLDDKGRIYLNRELNGDWAHDKQLIQITARVTARVGKLPANSKIHWKVIDPDDPFDDQTDVHRQWARYIDANDYTGAGDQLGAQGNDNEGALDRNPRWEEVPGHSLTVISPTEATTKVAAQISKVKLHCPNLAGDNLIVRAEFEPARPEEVFAAETGIMSMWNRIDVEYIRMNSAFALPVADVPESLEPGFIQLDFTTDPPVADKQFMAPSDPQLSASSEAYVTANFPHRADKGWFCVIAAMEPHPLPVGGPGAVLADKDVDLAYGTVNAQKAEFIDIDGDHPDADFIELSWPGGSVGFSVATSRVSGLIFKSTRFWLDAHDMQSEFKAGDGSIDNAYSKRVYFYPRGRRNGGPWTAGGYGMPNRVHAKVFAPGAFYTDGISPTRTVGGKDYFAGQTIIFTHHGAYKDPITNGPVPSFNTEIAQTIAHELTHAFGMPHKCGYWDYRTPREHTCCMNYGPNWMLDPATGNLAPGSSGKVSKRLCGRHIKELRRTHLEDNLGLGW